MVIFNVSSQRCSSSCSDQHSKAAATKIERTASLTESVASWSMRTSAVSMTNQRTYDEGKR